MERRAQGSTEYIIILGVALIVMVAALSFVVVEPQFAYSTKKQRSDEYWASARPFAIKSHAISQGHVILEMQNAEPVSLTVKEIRANGVNINFSKISSPYNESAIPMCAGGACSMPMSPGKTSIVITDNLNISEILQNICFTGNTFQEGRYYEVNLSISYQGAGGSETQASDIPIIGQCMRININDTSAGNLEITTAYLQQGYVGTPYSATLTATGCAGSCTWSFTGLPWSPSSQSGTSSCNNGASAYELTGTPSVNGTTIVSATVTDAEGRTDTKQFGLMTEYPPVELRIVTETLPDGMAGVQYKATVSATGGTYSGYSWSHTGDLPEGYATAQDGDEYVIFGNTEETRAFKPNITVRDNLENTASKALDLVILELAQLDIQGDPLPDATLNETYSTVLTASGCLGSCSWFVSGFPYASVSDPPVGGEGNEWDSGMSGLGGSNTYTLSGVPAILGTHNITITIRDEATRERAEIYALSVNPRLTITTPSPLPEGTQYQNYSTVLEADGCMQPCTWNVTVPTGWAQWNEGEGDAPGGSYTGYYSSHTFGFTPNQTGTASITAEITDSKGRTATKNLAITINAPGAPLRITTASLPDAVEGGAYNATLQATGGIPPYLAWSPASAGWPPGMALSMPPVLNGNARLSGTPAAGTAGAYTVTVEVLDSDGTLANRTLNLTVLPALRITTASPLPSVNVGTSYSALISATGGTGAYIYWGYSSLPAGLAATYVPSTQQMRISGVPSASGTYAFNVTVMDSALHAATKEFELLIVPDFKIATESPLPSGIVNVYYEANITATGCTNEAGGAVSWTVTGLPAGITASGGQTCTYGSANRKLGGSATQAGTYLINATAVNEGKTASRLFNMTVVPANMPRITGPAADGCLTLPMRKVWYPNYAGLSIGPGSSDYWTLNPMHATGGTGQYTWSCTNLPSYVSCSSDGVFTMNTPSVFWNDPSTDYYASKYNGLFVAKRANITVTDALGLKDSILAWVGWGVMQVNSTTRAIIAQSGTACLPDALSPPNPSGTVSFILGSSDAGTPATYHVTDSSYLPSGFKVGGGSCAIPSGSFYISGGNAQSVSVTVAAGSAIPIESGSADIRIPVSIRKNAITTGGSS